VRPTISGSGALLLCAFVVGCADKQQVSALQKQIDELQSRVEKLQQSVKQLERQQFLDRIDKSAVRKDYLQTVGDYSVIPSNLGDATVSLVDIRQVPDGTQLALNISAHGIQFSGATAKLSWGQLDRNNEPIKGSVRSRSVSLDPEWIGQSATCDGYLDGISRSEVEFVQIRRLSLIKYQGVK
jgi:hypothetical protein